MQSSYLPGEISRKMQNEKPTAKEIEKEIEAIKAAQVPWLSKINRPERILILFHANIEHLLLYERPILSGRFNFHSERYDKIRYERKYDQLTPREGNGFQRLSLSELLCIKASREAYAEFQEEYENKEECYDAFLDSIPEMEEANLAKKYKNNGQCFHLEYLIPLLKGRSWDDFQDPEYKNILKITRYWYPGNPVPLQKLPPHKGNRPLFLYSEAQNHTLNRESDGVELALYIREDPESALATLSFWPPADRNSETYLNYIEQVALFSPGGTQHTFKNHILAAIEESIQMGGEFEDEFVTLLEEINTIKRPRSPEYENYDDNYQHQEFYREPEQRHDRWSREQYQKPSFNSWQKEDHHYGNQNKNGRSGYAYH